MPSATYLPLKSHMAAVANIHGFAFRYIYGFLYSAYSSPNILLPIILGSIIDRHAIKEEQLKVAPRFSFAEKTLVFLTVLLTLGHTLYSAGVWCVSVPGMIVGRLLFGIGGESISVAQARLASATIARIENAEQELAAVFGVMSAVAQLGSVVNNAVSPELADRLGLVWALAAGIGLCLLSVVFSMLTVVLRPKDTARRKAAGKDPAIVRDSSMVLLTTNSTFYRYLVFFLLAVISFCYCGAMYPYNNVAPDYLRHRFYPDPSQHKTAFRFAMSAPDAVAIVLTICQLLYPRLTRKLARPIFVTIAGGIFFAIGHFWLLLLGSSTANEAGGSSPLPALLVLGLANTMVMWGWSVVPTLLPSSHHAVAYGLMTSTTNFALAVISPFIVTLIKLDESYRLLGCFFGFLGLAGLVLATILYYIYTMASGRRIPSALSTSSAVDEA